VSYTFEANWKWQIENLTDSYHFPATHPTYLGVLQRQVQRNKKKSEGAADSGVSSYANMAQMRTKMGRGCFDLGNGHSLMWGHTPNPQARPTYMSKDEIFARIGEARGNWMFYTRNLNIWPNLQFHDNIASMLVIIRPLRVDRTELVTYAIGPKGESAEARRRRIRHAEEFLNFGVANPDDLACYEACQTGFAARPDVWLDYARGMAVYQHGADAAAAELGIQPKGSVFGPFDMGDETGHQHGFREWRRMLRNGVANGGGSP
jgi:phenylpropionate dioxygenase-like ring-hydroxylating dioxygenase large terminal subunit